MTKTFTGQIERLTGARVLAYHSQTSTYFERDEPDPETVDEGGVTRPAFRTFGHSNVWC